MSEQHTVYYSDNEEELAEWVKQYESILGGRSDMYKRAIMILKDKYDDELKTLSTDDDDFDIIT